MDTSSLNSSGSTNSSVLHSENTVFSDCEAFLITFSVSIIIFVGSLGNSLMIYGVADDNRIYKVPTNIFLLSQSAADLAICSVFATITVITLHNVNIHIMKIVFKIGAFFSVPSITTLCFLTLDRLVSVLYSFKYSRVVTSKRARIIVILIWLFSAAIRIFDFTDYTHLQRIGRYVNIAAIVIFTISNTIIYIICAKKRTAIKKQREEVVYGSQLQEQATDLKSSATILWIMVSYIGGWLPVNLVSILVDRGGNLMQFKRWATRTVVIGFLSSALDPVIYYFCSSNFRRFIRRFYRIRIAPKLELQDGSSPTLFIRMIRNIARSSRVSPRVVQNITHSIN